MEREKLITEENPDVVKNGDGASSSDRYRYDSRVTFMVIFSTIMPFCGSFTYGTALGYTSPAQSGIMSELGLSVAQFSFFGAVLTIGGVIGAVLCGRITDIAGRRGALGISNAFCFVGWIMIAISKGAWSLDFGRLSLGVGIGIVSYVAPVYIVEITPLSIRGALTALNALMTGSGISISYLIGSVTNWRILAAICMVPCLLEFVGLFFIPESPRWLARVGREKESEAALQSLRGKNFDVSRETAEIRDYMNKLQLVSEDGVFELFQRRYARVVTIGVGLMSLQQFCGLSGYIFYMSFILDSAGFSVQTGTFAASIVQFSMSIMGILLIDKFGRRPLLMTSLTAMCLASVITGLSFLLQAHQLLEEASPILALTGVLVFLGSISIGMGAIPWIIVCEILPMNIKGSAGAIANLVSYSSNWLVSYTFNFLYQWNSAGVFFIYSIISGLGVIFVATLVPETKGRTLEEIYESAT